MNTNDKTTSRIPRGGGEGDKIADRHYRDKATAFSESFDPRDTNALKTLAKKVQTRIDGVVAELSEDVDEQAVEARRLLAEALHDLGNRLDIHR